MLYNLDASYIQQMRDLGKVNKLSFLYKFYTDKANINMHADRFASLWGGYAVYEANKKAYLKEGMLPEKAEAKAKNDFAEAVNQIQQSGEILFSPKLMRRKGLWKLFTMFQSQQAALWNLQVNFMNSIVNEIRNKQPNENVFKLSKRMFARYNSLIIMSFISSVLYFLAKSGGTLPEDDDEMLVELRKHIVELLIGNIPILGSMLVLLVNNMLFSDKQKYDTNMISSPVLGAYEKAIKKSIKLKSEWSKDDLDNAEIYEAISAWSPVTGLPVTPIERSVTGIAEFADDPNYRNLMRALGYGKSAIKE